MSSTLPTEIHQPSELYKAIIDDIQAGIAEGDSADVQVNGYWDIAPPQFADRQVLIEIASGGGGALQNDGRIAQSFECKLYAVIISTAEEASLQALNLVSALARRVSDSCWGFNKQAVETPEKIKLQESFLIEGNDDHQGFEAWEVCWHQTLNLGSPQYEEDPVTTGIWLAVNPVDSSDESEYVDITESCLNDSLIE